MTPVPSSGRRAAILLGSVLLLSLAFAMPVAGQDTDGNATTGTDGNATAGTDGNATAGTDGNATGTDGGATGGDAAFAEGERPATLTEGNFVRHFSVRSEEEACEHNLGAGGPCWDVNTFVVNPGDRVLLHGDLSSGSHDITIEWAELKSDSPVSFVDMGVVIPDDVPEDGLPFICSIHPETMIGTFKLEGSLGAHTVGANTLGVHFLAYWVGVIAFAILFVVYGATFFLFKYNETRAATDHWDRSDNAGGSKRLAAIAPLLAVVIGVVATAAIVYMAAR